MRYSVNVLKCEKCGREATYESGDEFGHGLASVDWKYERGEGWTCPKCLMGDGRESEACK